MAKSNRMLMSGVSSRSVNGRPASGQPESRRATSGEGPKLTIMLITVSFTFLLLTLPNNMALIVQYYTWRGEEDGPTVSAHSLCHIVILCPSKTECKLPKEDES